VYVRKDLIGEDAYRNFRSFDIGDIIGVEGKIFRTKTNELTIEAKFIRLLSKSLMSLPEMAWPYGCGNTLPATLSRPHSKSRGQGCLCKKDEDNPAHKGIS